MIVDGFMNWQVSVFVRRLITMIPALIVIAAGADTLRTLVASQVVLSLVLPFAVVPLVWLTSRREVMGELVNGPRHPGSGDRRRGPRDRDERRAARGHRHGLLGRLARGA